MPSILSLSDIPRSTFDRLKKDFQCSNKHLQEHITKYAYNHQKKGLFQTYFFVDDEGNYLSYISIATATIQRELIRDEIDISESMKYSIPAIKITRLCTFNGYGARGIATSLVYFANILATIQQKIMGCRAIIVDSKPEAIKFYQQFDFKILNHEEDSDTVSMVYNVLEPSELPEYLEEMIEFCEVHNQKELIELLKK